MKHLPFQSQFRADFEVVEERRGNISAYPHTEQLPSLLRALNLEFYGGLPARIARVDQRARGFEKLVLHYSSLIYCYTLNSRRQDRLRLVPVVSPDLVTKISIVQQITESTAQGRCHRFRFYAGADFFPEVYLSGRRVVVAEHALERFLERVPPNEGGNLSGFLLLLFSTNGVVMRVGDSLALVYRLLGLPLAFPFREEEGELFIVTCLTVNEINRLELEEPVAGFNSHYGLKFTRPKVRHWVPMRNASEYLKLWDTRVSRSPSAVIPPAEMTTRLCSWHFVAHWARDLVEKEGHGPGSELIFEDGVIGPCVRPSRPACKSSLFDEIELYQQKDPTVDWDKSFKLQDLAIERALMGTKGPTRTHFC